MSGAGGSEKGDKVAHSLPLSKKGGFKPSSVSFAKQAKQLEEQAKKVDDQAKATSTSEPELVDTDADELTDDTQAEIEKQKIVAEKVKMLCDAKLHEVILVDCSDFGILDEEVTLYELDEINEKTAILERILQVSSMFAGAMEAVEILCEHRYKREIYTEYLSYFDETDRDKVRKLVRMYPNVLTYAEIASEKVKEASLRKILLLVQSEYDDDLNMLQTRARKHQKDPPPKRANQLENQQGPITSHEPSTSHDMPSSSPKGTQFSGKKRANAGGCPGKGSNSDSEKDRKPPKKFSPARDNQLSGRKPREEPSYQASVPPRLDETAESSNDPDDDEVFTPSTSAIAPHKWATSFMKTVGDFNPKVKGADFPHWRQKFKNQAKLFALNDKKQLRMLDVLLYGVAHDEFKACKNLGFSLRECFRALMNMYKPERPRKAYFDEFSSMQQLNGQSVAMFANALRKKAQKAFLVSQGMPASEVEKLCQMQFEAGLRPELRTYVMMIKQPTFHASIARAMEGERENPELKDDNTLSFGSKSRDETTAISISRQNKSSRSRANNSESSQANNGEDGGITEFQVKALEKQLNELNAIISDKIQTMEIAQQVKTASINALQPQKSSSWCYFCKTGTHNKDFCWVDPESQHYKPNLVRAKSSRDRSPQAKSSRAGSPRISHMRDRCGRRNKSRGRRQRSYSSSSEDTSPEREKRRAKTKSSDRFTAMVNVLSREMKEGFGKMAASQAKRFGSGSRAKHFRGRSQNKSPKHHQQASISSEKRSADPANSESKQSKTPVKLFGSLEQEACSSREKSPERDYICRLFELNDEANANLQVESSASAQVNLLTTSSHLGGVPSELPSTESANFGANDASVLMS